MLMFELHLKRLQISLYYKITHNYVKFLSSSLKFNKIIAQESNKCVSYLRQEVNPAEKVHLDKAEHSYLPGLAL